MDNKYRLGDVFTLVGGGTPSTQKEEYWGEGTPWISSADINENGAIISRRKVTNLGIEDSTTNIVPGGSVIVVTRVGLGKVALLQEDMCFSQDIQGLVPKNNSLEYSPSFLKYQLSYIMQHLKYQGQGTTISGITKKKLADVELFLPNIKEQKHIVARIEELFSELDNGVETLRKTKQQLAVYRQAVLKDVFDGAVGCEMGTIQSVCINIVDCPHSTPKWASEGKICLRTTNFKRGYLDLSEKNYVSDETFDKRNARLVPMPGDVLYSREGAILGIACIIPDNLFACLGQRMMLLRTNEKMLGRFLMHYLNSPKVTSFVATKIGGSASPHVNVGDIKNFLVPIPAIEKQESMLERIESRLSVCDSIEKTVDTALQQAEAMRQSILKKAFEGKL